MLSKEQISSTRRPRFLLLLRLASVVPCIIGFAAGLVAKEKSQRVGFEIFTPADDASIAHNNVLVRYTGPIASPMAENLADIWSDARGKFDTVTLDINSPGGELAHAEKVIGILKQIRAQAALNTLVRQGQFCLSACILVFMQGTERIAGNATSWMFHGPCRAFTNAPTHVATERYLDLMREAGAPEDFLCALAEQGRLTSPGKYWLSGYELFHEHRANVITRLLGAWQSEIVTETPFDPQKTAR